ncbi:MAG: efflux RND transporter periplasmic adaptor subunit [Gemmatimonadota bacterium]
MISSRISDRAADRLVVRCARLAGLVALSLSLACTGATGGDAAARAAGPVGGAVTLWTARTELFMEHPALIVGAPDKFAVHLTALADFSPLRSGRITLRFVPRSGGAALVVTQDAPRAPGIYGPAPAFTAAGDYDLTLIVDSPQLRDTIRVPGLRVYASTDDAPRDEGEGDAGGIRFLKEQQWKTPGFRTAAAAMGVVAGTVSAPGTIDAPAGRYAEITAPVSGLVDIGGLDRTPAPGARVTRGQLLATLAPSLGDGGSAYADARARLRETEDEFSRATRLVRAEAAPARRLREAEIRLEAAREAMAGVGGAGAGGRIEIRAPFAGIVVRRTLVPGARVEAGAPLFTVVDPSVAWLTTHVPAAAASMVDAAANASFVLEGSDRRVSTTRLVSVGRVIDADTRTLPVIYEIANADGLLTIGSNAVVLLRTGRRERGVVIPESAVLDDDGRAIAYVQAGGERFERRELKLGARDGARVLVLEGIAAGERVVTGAAYQVRLASLSSAVPAHGHEH